MMYICLVVELNQEGSVNNWATPSVFRAALATQGLVRTLPSSALKLYSLFALEPNEYG